MTKRIIFNGDIANEGKCFRGYIVINDEFIETHPADMCYPILLYKLKHRCVQTPVLY